MAEYNSIHQTHLQFAFICPMLKILWCKITISPIPSPSTLFIPGFFYERRSAMWVVRYLDSRAELSILRGERDWRKNATRRNSEGELLRWRKIILEISAEAKAFF